MFNTMPTVSIILPIYNVEPYLRECIDSCIEQVDAPDYEIILVDDGSTDNCGAICDEYALLHDNIKVVHQRNSGLAAARNAGLALSTPMTSSIRVFCRVASRPLSTTAMSTWCSLPIVMSTIQACRLML